ncbi:secretoglobin family 2B member 2 [Dasypus novemcinctus]|uniref:secretoglobin family 2B member 2 n=1 Tax=Dasypus novemcinctus TaxID=9361 RepID=UPI0039C9B135
MTLCQILHQIFANTGRAYQVSRTYIKLNRRLGETAGTVDHTALQGTPAVCVVLLALVLSVQLGDACLPFHKLFGIVSMSSLERELKWELSQCKPSQDTEQAFLKLQQCYRNISLTERLLDIAFKHLR